MKKFLVCVFLFLMVMPVFAEDMSLARKITDDNLRQASFDNLVKSTYCALSATQHVTPNDIVSTGTYTASYLGTETGPLLMRVQNLGTTGIIRFKEYSTTVAAGISVTTATDAYLESKHGAYLATGTSGQLAPGETWEKIFYGEPDLTLGGVAAATFSVRIFKQHASE